MNLLSNINNIIKANNYFIEDLYKNKNDTIKEVFERNKDILKDYSVGINNLYKSPLINVFYRGMRLIENNQIIIFKAAERLTDRKPLLDYPIVLKMLEESEYFKDYPNRKKSIIFTNNKNKAKGFYWALAIVIPKNNSYIAVTPDDFNRNILRVNSYRLSIMFQGLLQKLYNLKSITTSKKAKEILKSHDLENIISYVMYIFSKFGPIAGKSNVLLNLLTLEEFFNVFRKESGYETINDFLLYNLNTSEDFLDEKYSNEFKGYLEENKNLRLIETLKLFYEDLGKRCITKIKYDNNCFKTLETLNLEHNKKIFSFEFWTEADSLLINHDFYVDNLSEFKGVFNEYN